MNLYRVYCIKYPLPTCELVTMEIEAVEKFLDGRDEPDDYVIETVPIETVGEFFNS